MYARAARRYREVDVKSAPKASILERLFSRCLRDIDDAAAAIETGEVSARANAINHAHQIVSELQTALDPKASPELCNNLAVLYDFALDRLTEANSRQDAGLLGEARAIIENIAESFRLAEAAQ